MDGKRGQQASTAYASDLGWPGFPLHSVRDGRCTCGRSNCPSPAKHPRTANGLKDATTDPVVIEQWWSRWPTANVAVATGVTAGLVVVDIDPRHDGDESVVELELRYGGLPRTAESLTGGGGRHLFFIHPGGSIRNRAKLAGLSGIDIRGDGGYVVAPPSLHISGAHYRWREDHRPDQIPLAALPAWLHDLLRETGPASRGSGCTSSANDDERSTLIRAATVYLARAHPAAEGERNSTAFNLAGHLRAFEVEGTGFRLTEAEVLDLLRPWNLLNRPPLSGGELARVVGSAMTNGTPRAPHKVAVGAQLTTDKTSDSTAWEIPEPLGRFELPSFPIDLLQDELCPKCPLWPMSAAIAESYQVPVDMPAMLALAVAGAALAKRVEVRINADWWEPVNLFVVIGMEPGERKSAVFREITAPLASFERDECERLAPEIERNRAELRILSAAVKHAEQQAAKQKDAAKRQEAGTRAHDLAEELRTTPRLVTPRLLADDATPEALVTLLFEQAARTALMSPEGGVFEQMAGRYSSNGMPNLDVYLKGHAGDDIRIDRVSRPAEFVSQPALTVGLAVQPDVLRGLVDKPGLRGRGLLARFLYSIPTSKVGHRSLRSAAVPEAIKIQYARGIRTCLELKSFIEEHDAADPLIVRPGREARDVLDQLRSDVERSMREGGDLNSLRDWALKLPGAVVRIAGILHGLEHAAGDNVDKIPLSGATMTAAVAIGRYLIDHAKAAFFEMGADSSIGLARRLLKWAKDNELQTLTRREAYRCLRGLIRKVDEVDGPLGLLIDHGYLRQLAEKRDGPGRAPSPTFEVNPAIHGQNGRNSAVSVNSGHSVHSVQEIEPQNARSGRTGSHDASPGLWGPQETTLPDQAAPSTNRASEAQSGAETSTARDHGEQPADCVGLADCYGEDPDQWGEL